MAEAILVPQVGQDLTEATVVELHVKVGDKVAKGDLVAVVESEKASFEVEAFAEGFVINLPYSVGDVATVLEPLMHLGAEGETVAPTASASASEPATSSVVDMQSSISELNANSKKSAVALDGPLKASPAARKRVFEAGQLLSQFRGSGPLGAVVLRDVEAQLSTVAAQTSGAQSMAGLKNLQSGHGDPIIFIHGFGSDLSSWRPTVGQLGLANPMYALDLPGHGSCWDLKPKSFDELVDYVAQTISPLGGSLHLVGHSLGAAVAVALSERGNIDIRSMSLLSPAGMGAGINPQFIDGFLSAKSEAALKTWMQSLVRDPDDMAPVLVRATLKARSEVDLVGSQKELARGLFENGTQLFSIVNGLRRFNGAASVLIGTDDAIVQSSDVIARTPSHAALYKLSGIGHLPQIECPSLVNTIVARTVKSAS